MSGQPNNFYLMSVSTTINRGLPGGVVANVLVSNIPVSGFELLSFTFVLIFVEKARISLSP